jgi:hypothetical protein
MSPETQHAWSGFLAIAKSPRLGGAQVRSPEMSASAILPARPRRLARVVVITCAVFLAGCGGDGGGGPKVRTYDQIIAGGWAAFGRSDYYTALAEFKTAVPMDTTRAEGYDGAGWSYALLDSLTQSRGSLILSLERDPTLADALVCLAAVYRDLPDLAAAVASAQQALALDPEFVFEHRTSYDWRDVRLILAECYYAMADYESAYLQVRELDAEFELDPGDEQFAHLLLLKIEQLVSTYGGI